MSVDFTKRTPYTTTRTSNGELLQFLLQPPKILMHTTQRNQSAPHTTDLTSFAIMGTTRSTPLTTLEASSSSCSRRTEDIDSIDCERTIPTMGFDENDLSFLEGNRYLHRQSTDSLCASIGRSEEEIEDDEWNERQLILEDAANLARLAEFHLNPHTTLVPSDPYSFGQNYLTRPPGYELHTMEGDEEEDDDIQERIRDTCIPDSESRDDMSTHLKSEDMWQNMNAVVSLDPSCVVRFGLHYDNHK
ncbi:unnamed protein product [Cylindrotheca closterium]|uniref:Uncharacterized protein n=1 Tax=Cylindrotheca closterium TaxID=2856 RepID=A0AAD2G6B5_9STRA|nr:unnamed protein product [Cylindrotheca closterium]